MIPGIFTRLMHTLPSQCRVCHAWPGRIICDDCVARFAQPQPRCQSCALALPAGLAHCGNCLKNPPPLDRCLAAVSYEFPWAGLIQAFKFHANPGLAQAWGVLLKSTPWVEPALEAADWVLPMPLSVQRLQSRGFNQSLLLAQALAPAKTHPKLLLRIRNTPPQSSLPRHERLTSLKDALALDPLLASLVRAKRVVLVDDVMTSGASLFTAAQTLRAAGASHITGLVIARTE